MAKKGNGVWGVLKKVLNFVFDPSKRSTKARDRTCSSICTTIKSVDIKGEKQDKLLILAVWNRSYKDRKRESNFGPNDPGKPSMWGIPTGGSESQEATEHVVERETYLETGYPVNRTIRFLEEFLIFRGGRGKNEGVPHPHCPYLLDVDPDFPREIREKDEIKKSEWMTFCEIVRRLKIGKRALSERRTDSEAFYYTHARYFIIPFFAKVYHMTREEIAAEKDIHYRNWLNRFQPYVIAEMDEHLDELFDLNLLRYNDEDTEEEASESSEVAVA